MNCTIVVLDDEPDRIREMTSCLDACLLNCDVITFDNAPDMIGWLAEHLNVQDRRLFRPMIGAWLMLAAIALGLATKSASAQSLSHSPDGVPSEFSGKSTRSSLEVEAARSTLIDSPGQRTKPWTRSRSAV